ncbi:MAG TPA: phosphoribosylamine--glycine ligase [Woeseiaceae bacterium]|nr:phosphoribosylamine--glycine ligase [Woeseiaceae bacterium]
MNQSAKNSDPRHTVLVLGYGAREHCLAWKIAQSPKVGRLFIAPGNAGTAKIGTNVPLHEESTEEIVAFALDNKIDLTVVGPNFPLAFGVVDAFQASGLRIFGPTRAAARLESSKIFAKAFMQRHSIPTAEYRAFTDYEQAVAYLDEMSTPRVVVKISGLGRRGRGVSVCDTRAEALAALRSYLIDGAFGESGSTVIIEERLQGPELSLFALADGRTVVPLLAVRDYKRLGNGDCGPNTGGMGAFGPPVDFDSRMMKDVVSNVLQRTVDGMAREGNPFVGILYAGLMLTDSGLRVLEFNARFGNPEALVVLPLLESDFYEAIEACIDGRLTPGHVRMSSQSAATVVLASSGYPESHEVGRAILGVEAAESLPGVLVFHHGTASDEDSLVTTRGRILAVTATGDTLSRALKSAYGGIAAIQFDGMYYRTDIGSGQ